MPRPGPASVIPPPLELECLKTLWELGASNVAAVKEALAPARTLAYTTVMTVLDRLARRGAVSRRKVGRTFVYEPLVSRESLRSLAVQELVDGFFAGSRRELVAYLTQSQAAAQAEPEPVLVTSLDPALL